MANAEIQSIVKIMGLQYGHVYETTKGLRYGHLMIMADQVRDVGIYSLVRLVVA